jgi:DNA polymerase
VFVIGDWSAIEARGLPWLADSPCAARVLDVFRRGEDIYLHTADEMGGYDRQIGKVATLALGFGGAHGALAAMGRAYGVYLPEHEAKRVVRDWRRANAWAPAFWKQLDRAAKAAIRHPGQWFDAGMVSYCFAEGHLGGSLLAKLPGGVLLTYPRTRIEAGEYGPVITAMKAAWTPKAEAKEWPRVTLWHGLLAENADQAFCARLLRSALLELDKQGLPVVLHTHDEIVLEVKEAEAEAARDFLGAQMCETPYYAPGLPLTAEPVIRERYSK